MKTFKKDTTLVGVSELRTKFKQILEKARSHKVVISKRDKELAVLIDIDRYNILENILDELEDYALGYIAAERQKTAKLKDYIDIEELEKTLIK
ncbi:MAG: type II toxin-antitoxin system prevent-host-death family antitoxin [Elusimicrobiota bacterium]